MLTAADLDPVLATRAELVAEALRAIYADQDVLLSLEVLQNVAAASNGIFTVSGLLLQALEERGLVGRFVNYLRPRGHDLAPVDLGAFADLGPIDFCQAAGLDPVADDIPFATLAAFTRRAQAFRCLIRVDGRPAGSGAFVSPRLVLTAEHVIATPGGAPARLEIEASDGDVYSARLAWFLPHHENERAGGLPPQGSEDDYADSALLRVDRPLGRLYGRIRLPDPPADWTGCGPLILVHYPEGVQKDFCPGYILRNGRQDLRQSHSIRTEGGSSGGPGFDREGRFLGLHQGRWHNVRRLVPYHRFFKAPGFLEEVASDNPPRYLWSLDGSLDSHIVIGRHAFFDALTTIVEGSAPMLRGIWIKRSQTERAEGLGFSFPMMTAYLDAHDEPHDAVLQPTGLDTPDLIGALHDGVFAAPPAGPARPGVQHDETTAVAHDDDRARLLADALEAQAAARGRSLWIYLENPPSGLLQETQIQLEHLVEELIGRPHLRLVLAGFETYDLLPAQFTTLAEARRSEAPGLWVEYLANFKRSDVEVTAKGISAALGLEWEETGALTEIVNRALDGVPEIARHVYALDQLPKVADNLRREAKVRSA